MVVFFFSPAGTRHKMEHKLILAVSGFPSLYDTNSPTYRDLNMRADSWRHVSDIVGVPGTFFDLLQRRTGCVPCVLCPPGVHRVSIGCPSGVQRVSSGCQTASFSWQLFTICFLKRSKAKIKTISPSLNIVRLSAASSSKAHWFLQKTKILRTLLQTTRWLI